MSAQLLPHELLEREPSAVDAGLEQVHALADRVAQSPLGSALIVGESGVGKEVLAARIHRRGARPDAPLVRVRLASLAGSTLEAELFGEGHGRGAGFGRGGLFGEARGGTLLLDEVTELGLDVQPRLLRALSERRIAAVRDERSERGHLGAVRVLSTSRSDPQAAVLRGELGADLLQRLSPVVLRVPPLRERPQAIAPLAERFLRSFRADFGRSPCVLGPAAHAALLEHRWPGNVRELRNVMERAALLTEGSVVTPAVLRLEDPEPPRERPITGVRLRTGVRETIDREERDRIAAALHQSSGSRTAAAERLGVSRSTLYERMNRLGMSARSGASGK